MSAHHSYHLPSYRALMAERLRGNKHGSEQFKKLNQARIVSVSDALEEALLTEYAAGRNVEYIAAHLGVSRDIVTRELRARGLPVGRWVKRAAVKGH